MTARANLPPRRVGPLPIIPEPETDEILSSWLTRVAANYNAKLSSLLEQIGCLENNPYLLDRRPTQSDIDIIALSLRRSRSEIAAMTFSGVAPAALDFVARNAPPLRCYKCCAEFGARGLHGVLMRGWHLTVATTCRRCGAFLRPSRHRIGSIIGDAIRDEEFRSIHGDVCRALERNTDDGDVMAAACCRLAVQGDLRHFVCSRSGKLNTNLLKSRDIPTSSVENFVKFGRVDASEPILAKSPTVMACGSSRFARRLTQIQ